MAASGGTWAKGTFFTSGNIATAGALLGSPMPPAKLKGLQANTLQAIKSQVITAQPGAKTVKKAAPSAPAAQTAAPAAQPAVQPAAPAAQPAAKAAVPMSAQTGLVGASRPDSAYEDHGSSTNATAIHQEFYSAGHQKWFDNLTYHEQYALQEYIDDGFRNLNAKLRGTNSAAMTTIEKDARVNLDAAIGKGPGLPNHMILYRAFPSQELFDGASKGLFEPGGVFEDPGYSSTGPMKKTALDVFLQGGVKGMGSKSFHSKTNGVLFRIRAPKGTKGMYTSFSSVNPYMHESEFVLSRNTKFKILKVGMETVQSRGKPYKAAVYDLEIIP